MLSPAQNATVYVSGPRFVDALLPGNSYNGIVRAQGDTLIAQVGRLQIPLDGSTALDAGQRVVVQVQRQGDSLQLTIRPQSAPHLPAPPDLATLLEPLLQQLGRADSATRLPALFPRRAPESTMALQALVTSLITERGTGHDIQQLQQFLTSATNQGILAPQSLASLSPWITLTALADAAAWEALVRQARSTRNAVARLARLIQGGTNTGTVQDLKGTLASLTQRLMGDDAFQTWLRNQGTQDEFKALGKRILERATGSELQNLRALDQPYQFLELPLSDASGLKRIQIHNFTESHSTAETPSATIHRTVLDLDTTRLGLVWVDLRAQGTQCRCQFRLMSADLAAAVEATAEELETGLKNLGYIRAHVTADTWDGDREQALLALLAPFQSLDLEA